MKSIAIRISAISILCALPSSQNLAAQEPSPPASMQRAVGETDEQQGLELALQKMQREHSDANGNIRPDLYAKAFEHIQHMKVAGQIGPDTNDVPPDKN